MESGSKPRYFGHDLEAMSLARNYHRWILSECLPYLGDSVAEVGAGAGSFSELLLETPLRKLKAYEPSRNMFPLLRETLSREPRASVVNDFFGPTDPGERFDSILYINVLEHVETDGAELARAREALADGGHLVIFVPALQALYSPLDRQLGHFRRYTRGGLARLVRQAGFDVLRARYFDVAGILPWYIHFVLLKNTMAGGSVALYDRCVVPVMRRVEKWIPPPLGKNVFLVARKTGAPRSKNQD